tara:strand:+ start:612 stop:1535 length:924 start_codon:yes stop_codon:yes gene_type:complete
MFESKLINLILNDSLFKKKPIVLMHLGAAGSNFNDWKKISKNSVLISLDGNDKIEKININFKKIIKENIIISNKKGLSKFYVTKDPHCSSLLKPDLKINNSWYFSHRFKIQKKIKVKTTTINDFLSKHKLNYIDWFVIDIQGMDLKVVKDLKDHIRNKIKIINIEPGFEKFYEKEDSFLDIYKFLNKKFQFSDMKFGFNFKIKNSNLGFLDKKFLFLGNTPSKVYTNLIFTNKKVDKRTILIKIIYLLESNKYYEAKNIIDDNFKKHRISNNFKIEINRLIFLNKIILIGFYPYFFIKKVLINFLVR